MEILSAFEFFIEYSKAQKHGNTDSLTCCDNPWDSTCSEVENFESLKCGPCAKCIKRIKEMQGFVRPLATESTEPQTEQDSIRAVSQTAGDNDWSIQGSSSDTRGPLNQWLTDQDLARVQSKDPEMAPITRALAKGERPPHSEVVALCPAVR